MKLRLIWIFLVLLCIGPYLYVSPAFAAEEAPVTPVAQTETHTLSKGDTLWAVFEAQKLPRKDWPQYWKNSCAHSQITCTDEAWKKLPVGTIITTPRDPRVVSAEQQAEVKELIATISTVRQALVELRQSLNEMKNAQTELHTALQLFWIVMGTLGIFIAVCIGIMVHIHYRSKRNKTSDRHTCEATEGPQRPYPHTPPHL